MGECLRIDDYCQCTTDYYPSTELITTTPKELMDVTLIRGGCPLRSHQKQYAGIPYGNLESVSLPFALPQGHSLRPSAIYNSQKEQ